MIGSITLNPSIDRNIVVHKLVKDDANRAKLILETPGGKGINVSKVVRELGGSTRAFALLGGFAGGHLREIAKPLDFPISAVPIGGSTRINTIITDRMDHTQTRISAPGPCAKAPELRALLRRLTAFRPRPFFWALGGSLAPGLPAATYRDLIFRLQKAGTPCILDADDEALRCGIEAKPFMIKPNEFEMQRLCRRRLRSVKDYLAAGRSIQRRGVKLVLVSLGAKGALFITDSEAFLATAPQVPVRSKVGAGDSLIGGVALGLVRGMRLQDAARLGIAASVSAVMREAPRLCLKKDIPRLWKRIRIQRL